MDPEDNFPAASMSAFNRYLLHNLPESGITGELVRPAFVWYSDALFVSMRFRKPS